MSEISYHQNCPSCGGPLQPNAMGPQTPPWRCDECLVSWWASELTPVALQAFRRERWDWGDGGTVGHSEVREAVRVEAEKAAMRGVSLREEQIELVHPDVHKGLLNRAKIAPGFADKMRTHLASLDG